VSGPNVINRITGNANFVPVELQERRLDRTVLRTYRATVDLDHVVPNPKQPRLGPKEDDELQRQIEATKGYSSHYWSNHILIYRGST
jgi:ParB family transcriptional regulator, chromosome partitioning protein